MFVTYDISKRKIFRFLFILFIIIEIIYYVNFCGSKLIGRGRKFANLCYFLDYLFQLLID